MTGAWFEIKGIRYVLNWIPPEEFDHILKSKRNRNFLSYPAVWSEINGEIKVWPTPAKNVKVEFVRD